MACKVERLVERGHLALFHISGYLRERHLNLIEEMMAKETDPVAFDLAEVTLVDSDAVKFLAACDAKGIEIRNCAAFIREWMSKVERGELLETDRLLRRRGGLTGSGPGLIEALDVV